MSADVELDGVWVKFGDFTAVRDANIRIQGGEFFSFLGPSGCGKTTLLRTVSGFLDPTEGHVRIGGADMLGIGPNKRPTAMIFQNLALFPLMTVAENIAFGLEVRGVGKVERRKKAEELLDLIALPDQADKKVQELSGGQRQRVAIARALAVEPEVLLLDEPLSALDLKLRQHMRSELRAIQKRVGITFIYITHDQGEALTMSDRVAVMSQGVVEQVADSTDLYDRPATAFVASFVGENNAFHGKVIEAEGEWALVETASGQIRSYVNQENASSQVAVGDAAIVFVRPEAIRIAENGDQTDNSLPARLVTEEFEGSFRHLALESNAGEKVTLSIVNDGAHLPYELGRELMLQFPAAKAVALPEAALAEE